jgi:hypothetical protein
VGGDQDQAQGGRAGLAVQPPGELQAALAAEVDVQQGHIRLELLGALERIGAVGRHADDADALPLQEAAGGVQEPGAVVDDEAAHHAPQDAAPAAGAHSR